MLSIILFFQQSAFANPYWDPQRVPRDSYYPTLRYLKQDSSHLKTITDEKGIDVLRIQIDWQEGGEKYIITKMVIEPSGTPAFIARSTKKPKWGSYQGVLKNLQTRRSVYYDAIGTGKTYRTLTRAITFRFPVPKEDMFFELFAENPQTGVMEKVVSQYIDVKSLQKQLPQRDGVVIKLINQAQQEPSLRVNIYAEGYAETEQALFYRDALKAVRTLEREKFPGFAHMSFYGVFHASNQKLGEAKDLGMPVPEYDSFLGLYYPYWMKFGRWYNVVYPTREDKLRSGLATAPYDYPLILVNNGEYWGVGNYMMFTAVPARSDYYFTYLLLHEIGHFFGLNEEYTGGGPTELEFAEGLQEPWSQNITFYREKGYEHLKWKKFVDSKTPIPTPRNTWHSPPPVYGAYTGAYADSKNTAGPTYKPGLSCMMENAPHFCDICKEGIQKVVTFGLGTMG